jgi:hypothetical protein
MPTPKRFTNGVTTVASSETMGQLIVPDPTTVVQFMDDFFKFDPGDWLITRTHTGGTSGVETISDATNGILAFYPANADNDNTFFQFKGYSDAETASELFTVASGKKLWFKSRLKVSDTGDSDFIIGLQNADTTPLTAPADGIYFKSDDGDDALDFQVYASSSSALADTSLATLVDDTYFTVGFYWDGSSRLRYYHNDNLVGTSTGGTVPSTELTISFGVQNGSAAARTMSMDYVCAIRER